ncbi:MAG TPA: hypothetical protein VF609_13010 [Flavisolibacter sp.]|jgi:hypothetical protein
MKKFLLLLAVLCCYASLNAQTFTPPAYAEIDNNYPTYPVCL